MLRFTIHAFVAAMMLAVSATAAQAGEREATKNQVKNIDVSDELQEQMIANFAELPGGQALKKAVGKNSDDDIEFKTLKVGNVVVGYLATSDADDAPEFRFDVDGGAHAAAEPFQRTGTNTVRKAVTSDSPVGDALAETWKTATGKTKVIGALFSQVTPYGYVLALKKDGLGTDLVYASANGAWANRDLVLNGIPMLVKDAKAAEKLPAALQPILADFVANPEANVFVTPWGYDVRDAADNARVTLFDHAGEEIAGTAEERQGWIQSVSQDPAAPVGYLAAHLGQYAN